jgi:hypothetical protein
MNNYEFEASFKSIYLKISVYLKNSKITQEFHKILYYSVMHIVL